MAMRLQSSRYPSITPVELRQIRYFVAVAQELHFGRAARRLRVSQPPLSRQISALEREVGVTLLRRTSHQVELTEAGRVFLRDCREIVAALDRATAAARDAGDQPAGPLRIGFVDAMGWPLKDRILQELVRRHPRVVPMLEPGSSADHVRAVVEHQLDLGVIWDHRHRKEEDGLDRLVVREDPVQLAVARDHSFARRRQVPLAGLSGEPLIMGHRRENPGVHDAMMAALQRLKVRPQVRYSTGSAIIDLVAAGLGVAFITAASLHGMRPDIVVRPLQRALNVQLIMVWRRDSASPSVRGFVEIARELKEAGQLA